MTAQFPKKVIERFWSKVDRTGGCWLVKTGLSSKGYGQFSYKGHNYGAHVISYLIAGGEIPDGYELDHLCRVRNCVRPDHLEPVPAKENVLRGEGITAHNARKTHCAKGHLLAGENAAPRKGRGGRRCRTCSRERARRIRATLPRNPLPHGATPKLNEDQVREIKAILRAKSMNGAQIAAQYGVNKNTIYDIKQGRTWDDIE